MTDKDEQVDRYLAEKGFGLCWHEIVKCEWDGYNLYESYCSCGAGPYNSYHERSKNELFGMCNNPRFSQSIPLLKEHMKSAGEWDEFIIWHDQEAMACFNSGVVDYDDVLTNAYDFFYDVAVIGNAEILTDARLLAQAAKAYFEVKEER